MKKLKAGKVRDERLRQEKKIRGERMDRGREWGNEQEG